MIAEKAAELIRMVHLKQHLVENVDRRKAYESRLNELTSEVLQLTTRLSSIRALKSRGVAGPDAAAQTSPLLERVEVMRESFAADPAWIIDYNSNPFKGNLKGLRTLIDTYIKDAWGRYVSAKLPAVSEELLDVLRLVPDLVAAVDEVRGALRDVQNLRKEQLPDDSSFAALDNSIVRIEQALDHLRSDEVPQAVMAFLRAAAGRDGAPLNSLTPEVITWLEERHVAGSFGIRARSQTV